MDTAIKYLMVMVLLLPCVLVFHDSMVLQAVGGAYIFGLAWLAWRGNRAEKEQSK